MEKHAGFGWRCQTACKPGFVRAAGFPEVRDDHSSWTRLAARLTRPTRAAERERLLCLAALPPLFGLAPGGVYPAAPVARGAVRSCRTVSPLPAGYLAALARAVCFLWHFPWGRPRRPLAGTVFPWSPDFPLTPQVKPGRDQRPSGRLAAHDMCEKRQESKKGRAHTEDAESTEHHRERMNALRAKHALGLDPRAPFSSFVVLGALRVNPSIHQKVFDAFRRRILRSRPPR